MRLLLDTHVAVWWLYLPQEIAAPASDLLHRRDNQLFISAASLWEAAIKLSGRGMPPADTNFFERVKTARITVLQVEAEHAWAVLDSPLRHKDPFDRLIWAQAHSHNMLLVTRDREMRQGSIQVVIA